MNSALDLQSNDTTGEDLEQEMPDSKTNVQAIVVLPLAYKRPNDDSIFASTSSGKRRRRTAETPEGWICEPRARKNGVIDKFYYHKHTNVRCRSLKEIQRYSLHGIRPGPRAKELEKEILAAEMRAKAREKEIRPSTEARVEGVVAKNKGKSKVHTELVNKNEHHQSFVQKLLAEAWHNMTQPTDIQTGAWAEMEMKQQEEEGKSMEMKLQEEREKMIRKFEEERKELERNFEEERAQLHQWMKDEIDYRIQLQLDAIIPTLLKGKNIAPASSDSAGI